MRVWCAGFLMILCVALTGCAARAPEHLTDVALSMCDLDTARSMAVCSDVLDVVTRAGLRVELRDAGHSLSRQIDDIEALLAQKPRYLLICAVKSIGLRDVIRRASEQGVRVIQLDRFCVDAMEGDVLASIGMDAEWAGQACARALAEVFAGQPASILEIPGEPGAFSTNGFSKGFRDELCKYPNLQIAGVLPGGFSRATAQRGLLDFIAERGGAGFDAVFGHGDEQGIGAINAFLSLEEKNAFPVVCVGGQDDARRALLAGRLFADVEISPRYGEAVLGVMQNADAGKPFERTQLVRGRAFTQEDAAQMAGY